MSIGLSEIILIFLVILILFGSKKIPELVKALARAEYEYKKAKENIKKEEEKLEDITIIKSDKKND